MTMWTPPIIEALTREVEEQTGTVPVVERVNRALWRVTIANHRVKNVIEFKLTAGNRVLQHKSTLWVDGQQRPLCKTHEAFYELFLYPDEVLAREGKPFTPPEMPPLVETWETAPELVRIVLGMMQRAARKLDARLVVGAGEDVWAAQIEDDFDGVPQLVRVTLEFAGGAWRILPLLLVRAGRRVDPEGLTDTVRKALADLLRNPGVVAPSGGGPVAGASSVRGPSNAVTVRRATVIRT